MQSQYIIHIEGSRVDFGVASCFSHLDRKNRNSLMSMLERYYGTLMIASHDTELLRNCIDILWHIDQGRIHVFSGDYDDYIHEMRVKRRAIEQKLSRLSEQKKDTHRALMKEQLRAKKRKAYGEKKYFGDKLALRGAQARGEKTANKKKKEIAESKKTLKEQLSSLRLPKIITPKFSLSTSDIGNRNLVAIVFSAHYSTRRIEFLQLPQML